MSQLLTTIQQYVEASNLQQARSVIENHPELLGKQTDVKLSKLIKQQSDAKASRKLFKARNLLRYCQQIGIAEAFVEEQHIIEMVERMVLEYGPQQPYACPLPQLLPRVLDEIQSIVDKNVEPLSEVALILLGLLELELPPPERLLRQYLSDPTTHDALITLSEHPELLTEEAQEILERLSQTHFDRWSKEQFVERYELLNRCRVEGTESQFFGLITHADPTKLNAPKSSFQVPPEFESEMWEYQIFIMQLGHDPEKHSLRMAMLENLLGRASDSNPGFRAALLNDLGLAYAEFPTNNPTPYLVQAIKYYQEALRIRTHRDFPQDYAATQNNLGNSYSALPTGDRTVNLYNAIECFQNALTVPDIESSTLAGIQTNLGVAFLELPKDSKEDNIDKAIECFQRTLSNLNLGSEPLQAVVLNKLGGAYLLRHKGNRSTILKEAIRCFREALKMHNWGEVTPFPKEVPLYECASIMHNLGTAYYELTKIGHEPYFEEAISCFLDALSIYTVKESPIDFANTQNNLGNVYAELARNGNESYRAKAIGSFQKALEVLSAEVTPADYRMAQQNLGNLFFYECRWENARDAFDKAITAIEFMYKASLTEHSRQAELSEVQDIFSKNSYCLARLGRLSEAVEQLEAFKARTLSEALALDQVSFAHIASEDKEEFKVVRDIIRTLEAESHTTNKTSSNITSQRAFIEISADLSVARHNLDQVVKRIRANAPDFLPTHLGFAEISATPLTSCPLVYLITTDHGSLALIVSSDVEDLNEKYIQWLDDFDNDDLNNILWFDTDEDGIGGYVLGQIGEQAGVEKRNYLLKNALNVGLPVVGEKLMGPLASHLKELGFDQITLIPCGRLVLLPLHCAMYSHNATDVVFIEEFDVNFAYSARSLLSSQLTSESTNKRSHSLFAIADPPHKRQLALDNARLEVEAIALQFTENVIPPLYGNQATLDNTMQHIEKSTYIHFACHGMFDMWEPLQSSLLLAGQECLYVQDILNRLDLRGTRLVVLSACHSAIPDFLKIPDEAIGFPASFIQSGAIGVAGSLWWVSDISAALLWIKFYEYHLVGDLSSGIKPMPPAKALKKAQLWLKNVTIGELKKMHEGYLQHFANGEELSKIVRKLARKEVHKHDRKFLNKKPFNKPFHWAAFTLYGL